MQERDVAGQAIQAMVQQEKAAANKLRDDLDRMKKELERAKVKLYKCKIAVVLHFEKFARNLLWRRSWRPQG
jgi:hypothetical protein